MRGSRSSSLRLPVQFILLVFLLILLLLLFVLLFVLLFFILYHLLIPRILLLVLVVLFIHVRLFIPLLLLPPLLHPPSNPWKIYEDMDWHAVHSRTACCRASSANNSPGNFFQYKPEGTRSVTNTVEPSQWVDREPQRTPGINQK